MRVMYKYCIIIRLSFEGDISASVSERANTRLFEKRRAAAVKGRTEDMQSPFPWLDCKAVTEVETTKFGPASEMKQLAAMEKSLRSK